MNEAVGRFHLESAIAEAKGRNARRAAQQLGERAAEARDNAATFITERPFIAIAGALAVGVLIGALLPRPKIGKRAGAFTGVLTRAGLDYGRQAVEKALHAYQTRMTAEVDDNAMVTQEDENSQARLTRFLPWRSGR